MPPRNSLDRLLARIRACDACADALPHDPNPVLYAGAGARIAIIGQAPGAKVHESGVAWDDASGKRLRAWLGVNEREFYDRELFAIIPMGFCYPGRGTSGDLPPRPECAPLWHEKLFGQLPNVELRILVGSYAQSAYLGESAEGTLTETVRSWKKYQPDVIPLPHPSPRNNIWLKKNQWFDELLLPELRRHVRRCLT